MISNPQETAQHPGRDGSSAEPVGPVPEGFRQELVHLYEELDREIERLGVRCQLSGRCCRFDEWGHMLFVSWVEAKLLAAEPPSSARLTSGRCPYQVGNLCTAHARRPLGCRVFFCDPTYQEVMAELAERYHDRLKRLYLKYGLPWRYGPLHTMLAPWIDHGR